MVFFCGLYLHGIDLRAVLVDCKLLNILLDLIYQSHELYLFAKISPFDLSLVYLYNHVIECVL